MGAPYLYGLYPFAVDLLGDEPEGELSERDIAKMANRFERSARLFRLIEKNGWRNAAPRIVYNQDEYGTLTLLATREFVETMVMETVLDQEVFETVPHEISFLEEKVFAQLLKLNASISEEAIRDEVYMWEEDDLLDLDPEWVMSLIETHVAEGGISRVEGKYDFRIVPYGA